MDSQKPLLVLGASSLIGQALDATRPDLHLVRLTRMADRGPDWIQADLSNPELADQLASSEIPRCDTALGLAPIWVVAPAIEALARSGIRRIVAFSSTSRWTKIDSPDASERDVAARLVAAEAAFVSACQTHGVTWTLLRPTLIYLEGRDGNVSRLASLIRRLGFAPLAGGGGGRRQPVHAADLALGALAALDHGATHNRAYDLPGGETLTYRQMVTRIFEGMGRRPRILAVPGGVWSLAFLLARPFLPGATAAMGVRMEADLIFDPGPAIADFGWTARGFRPQFSTPAPPHA